MLGAIIQKKPIKTSMNFSDSVSESFRTEVTKKGGFLEQLYKDYGVTDPEKQVFYQARVYTKNLGNPLLKELSESTKPVGSLKVLANKINTIEAIPDLVIVDKEDRKSVV